MKRIVNRLGKLIYSKRGYAIFVLSATIALAARAPAGAVTFHITSFNGTNGATPFAGLLQAANTNLYGTTSAGGANGDGTVFSLSSNGTVTTVHSFNLTDGALPEAGLIQATNGNLYGTTFGGGTNKSGTIFKLTPNGTLTTLYNFCSASGCTDGEHPTAALVQASNGNVYGTTSGGGVNGSGTVFKINNNGTLTTIYNFCSLTGCTDGSTPQGALIQGTDGNFYGTTSQGGTNNAGTVFQITSTGISTLTTLYSFCSATSCTDGFDPVGGLVQGTDGNFYGTTAQGGAHSAGTVFQITSSGTLMTLHSFHGSDGESPEAALIQGTDGNFYGTTDGGGAVHVGTIFSITSSGTFTMLGNFSSGNGGRPNGAGLIQGADGNFYGTASQGGSSGNGTVYKMIL